jgi:vitamin B12 transporter
VLESIVVTAARVAQPAEEAVHPTTVITAEEIARSGQSSLVDVLQVLGGVEVSRNGGNGQLSSVFLRGANFNHTLVLVDGVRVSSATSGATAFENIPVNLIERIEIVPGPASGLYGSDAIGGVVQVFTRAPGAPSAYASAGGGSDATRSFKAGASGVLGETSLRMDAGYFETRGFSATKPTIPFGQFNPDDDGFRNSNVSARLLHRHADAFEIGATFMSSQGRTWFDAGEGFDDLTDERLQSYSFHLRNFFTSSWESLIRVGEGRDEATTRGSVPSIFNTRQPQATWQNTVTLPVGTLIAGLEFMRQRLDTDQGFTTTQRDVKSYFAGWSGHAGAHGWQLNARHDDNDQFGAHSTGSAAYAYSLNEAWRVRVSAGNAFKAPTFNDLYYPFFGNPDLKPERSHSAEAGFDWKSTAHSLSATWFDNRIEDVIVFDFASSLPQNIASAHIRGADLSYRYAGAGCFASIKATLQHGDILPRRARQHGAASAGCARQGWTVTAEIAAASQRFDAGEAMHGYGLLNLTVERELRPGLVARLRWNNVADREYELARHYNTPGSNAFLEVSQRW